MLRHSMKVSGDVQPADAVGVAAALEVLLAVLLATALAVLLAMPLLVVVPAALLAVLLRAALAVLLTALLLLLLAIVPLPKPLGVEPAAVVGVAPKGGRRGGKGGRERVGRGRGFKV